MLYYIQITFFDFKLQQTTKHINKSIIGANVSMCLSNCLVPSERTDFKFLIHDTWIPTFKILVFSLYQILITYLQIQ